MFIKPKTIRYRWMIVVCSFVVFALSVSISYNCWSVFTIPISEGLSISRNNFGRLYSWLLIGQMISSFMFGRIIKKVGATGFLRCSSVVLTAMILMMSFANGTVSVWLFGLVIGFFLTGNSYLMFSVVVANWFITDCGLITGIIMMSSGVMSSILLPFSDWLITNLGWRIALRVLAVIMIVVELPLCLLFLYSSPQEVGLEPYKREEGGKAAVQQEMTGYEAKEMFHLAAFWHFMLFSFGLFALGGLSPTVVPYLCDMGYSSKLAANISAMGMVAVSVGRILGGKICDKFNIRLSFFAFAILSGCLVLGLIGAEKYLLFCVLIIIGHGAQQTEASVCYPLVIRDMFGQKNFAEIYGIIKGIGSAISALIPMIYGLIYDKAGSYLASYRLFAVIYVVSLACLYLAFNDKNISKKMKPNNENML